jgi:ribosome-associated translation inhibitor RaiA
MREPDRLDDAGRQLSPEERRRIVRAAFLRPMNLLVVVVGGIFFALTLLWWTVPLTLATYAALVFLAVRDPLLRESVLGGRDGRISTLPEVPREERNVSPERRARWLPRGETRQKVEAALEIHRRTVFAIEESDDVVQAVLDDALPKLHRVAGRLVDIAEKRERAAEAIRTLEKTRSGAEHRVERDTELAKLENTLRAADTEISSTFEKLSTLRARIVRISVESGVTAQGAAAELNADLDKMNLHLDALRSTMVSPEER